MLSTSCNLSWGPFFRKLLFITCGVELSLLMSVTVIMLRVCMHMEVTSMQDIRKKGTIQCLFSTELWVRWVMGRPTQNLCLRYFTKSSAGFCRIWLLDILNFSHVYKVAHMLIQWMVSATNKNVVYSTSFSILQYLKLLQTASLFYCS